MKVDTKIQNETENKDSSVQLLPEDANLLETTNVPFSCLISEVSNGGFDLSPDSITGINAQTGFDFRYDVMSMSEEEARFFVNLAQGAQYFVSTPVPGMQAQIYTTEFVQNAPSAKAVEAANKITELIETAQKTQKPVRISFDNDVSVVLKIDKHGKLTAEFIPGSIEAENYLRNNVASLRQKFDEQNLPYNDILYKENSKKNDKRQRRNKGE